MSGLDEFLDAWDATRLLQSDNSVSEIGNVNIGGDPASIEASILTKDDPEFSAAIESGVRELVTFLVDSLGCVTYSSCEGHRTTDRSDFRQRHVGVLPRCGAEQQQILQIFLDASNATTNPFVEVAIVECVLESDIRSVPCIDIIFRDNCGDENEYFSNVNSAYDAFLGELISGHSAGTNKLSSLSE